MRPTPGQVYADLDKRNTGFRIVQVEQVCEALIRITRSGKERELYAACRILTAGGRPCHFTDTPWLRGTGAVGQITYIRIDRLMGGRYYRRLDTPPFDAFEGFDPSAAAA